jgi:hypothetical protein
MFQPQPILQIVYTFTNIYLGKVKALCLAN